MAALDEEVQPNEKGVESQFPFPVALCLVFEVGLLKLDSNINGILKALAGLCCLQRPYHGADHLAIDVVEGLGYDSVADLTDEHY